MTTETAPRWDRPPHAHENGRVCFWRATWTGNPRDGHWRWDYWYRDTDTFWRYCGGCND